MHSILTFVLSLGKLWQGWDWEGLVVVVVGGQVGGSGKKLGFRLIKGFVLK